MVHARELSPWLSRVKGILREPLIHFLLIGAGLYLVSLFMGPPADESSLRIVITSPRIEQLAAAWSRQWMRQPSVEELRGLVEAEIRQEVYYREALALGLDRDDEIIKRRLQQKLEFIGEDLLAQAEPTDADLQAYLDQHPEDFRQEATVSFNQLYLSREKRGDAVARDAQQLLARLNAAGGGAPGETSGDPFPLPDEIELQPESDVARMFGQDFATRIMQLPMGRWAGPIESGYGLHLVRVRERTDGRPLTLAEAREEVARAWSAARRRELNDEFYAKLRAKYVVTVEPPGDSP